MPNPTYAVELDLNRDFVYEHDITADFSQAVIKCGRDGDVSQARAGTCELTLPNNDGKFTPLNSASALYPDFHPLGRIRVQATYSAVTYDRFTGFIERIFVHPQQKKHYVTVFCGDWMWVMSRTDFSLPLMRDVRSGTYIERIADYTEIGELVTNPRFRDDLTGYSAIGGAPAPMRVTTGVLLEGAAAIEVDGSGGAGDGVRYTVPSGLSASDKATARVYPYAADSASEGDTVLLRLRDDVGSVGASAAVTLTNEPQAVDLTATYNGGAAAFYIEVEVVSGTPTFRVGAFHQTLFKKAIPRSIDDGRSVFAYIAPRRVNALEALREAAENELNGYVYVDRSGVLTFEDQHHRWTTADDTKHTVSQGTIDDTMADVPYEEDGADLVGIVELGYAEWVEGTPGTQVWSANRLPRAIGPNDSITIPIDFNAIVRDLITPVANTDYTINASPDGAGADESGNVTLAFDDFGGGARAVFTNAVARTVHLTKLVLRGTTIRVASDTPEVVYEPSGAPEVASKISFTYRQQSSLARVTAHATYLGDRHVTQRERLPVRVKAKDAARLVQILARKMSERVTITNDAKDYATKVSGDYYIDSTEERIRRRRLMEVTWGCVPVDADMFILDSSALDGADVLAP